MMQIAGYPIEETIYQGKKTSVYRTKPTDATPGGILKIMEKRFAQHHQDLRSLQKEYEFLSQVNSPYVIKATGRIDDKDYSGILLEDTGGATLKEHIKKNKPGMEQFITLAIGIAKGLAAIHGQNIIHKDINPANIVWNSKTGSLKIIDFNIASQFDIKLSYLGNPEKLHGTLPYISPEQTGRMNRRVDQRTDLYSLGVTFYEMVTGRRPFDSHDAMEIVYAHLARNPEPPHQIEKQVPGMVSKIILKLLAKNPDQRYQSTDGLIHDLEKFRQLKERDFELGEKDFSGTLQIPGKLYGREQEIQRLQEAYRETAGGSKKLVLVPGYSGTGKTSLVQEIHKYITGDNGYFISGKFDQLQRNIPYFAFIQALNQFCQLLLSEKEDILAQWKKRILDAVENLGKVLTDIIPQLEAVIGKQPDVPEVGGEEGKIRSNYVFQRFLHTVATEGHPLVVFIDDLQWADLASLNFLEILAADRQNSYLLFIGAYRDNEVSPSHPFMTSLDKIRETYGEIETIPVANLSMENVQEWLKDTLKTGSTGEVEGLAALIYDKTQGNAFFTTQFLENLCKERLLRFDFTTSQWTWDIKEIEKQDITDNVVDFMVGKIRLLPEGTQEVLKLAACIGNTFALNALSVISGKNADELEQHLETALTQHLVYPVETGGYNFVHDRIHQAAYSLIGEETKKTLHLQIGRLLLKDFQGSRGTGRNLFEIVNHLNIGIGLIKGEKEKIELARLNLRTAGQARASAVYSLASDYIHTAMELLPAGHWQQHYDLALDIYNEAIQASYLCGNFQEMEDLIKEVFTNAANTVDRTIAYQIRMLGHFANNQVQSVVETLMDALNRLDVKIPAEISPDQVREIMDRVQNIYKSMDEEAIKKLPPVDDPKIQLAQKLFTIGFVGMLLVNPELYQYTVAKMMELLLEKGLTSEAPYVFSLYGMVMNNFGDVASAYRFGNFSMELLDIVPHTDVTKHRTIYMACAYLLGWKEHYKQVGKRLRENYQNCLNVGDIEYACYSITNYGVFLNRTDTELTAMKAILDTGMEVTIQFNQQITRMNPAIELPVVAALMGETADPAVLEIDFNHFPANYTEGIVGQIAQYFINIRKLFAAYLFENNASLLEYINLAEPAWEAMNTPVIYFKVDLYFYIPLAYLRLYTITESEEEKKQFLEKAGKSINAVKEWAELGPMNFLHKYYLMQAELYRVTGKPHEAGEYYDMAVEKAFENEYINEAALANELAARFYLEINRPKLVSVYLLEARNCYRKWGAAAKVKQLEEKYPKYLSLSILGIAQQRTVSISTSSSTDSIGDLLDIKSIVKATQTLSGEVQLRGLMEKMMQILIENAGAKKCLLIENTGESLLIQAEGSTYGVSGVLQGLPMEESDNVPLSVINYVARSKERLVFDNISKDPNYSTDSYIQKNQTKSVVCFPILSKGKLSAVIYLENSLVEGAFTPERLELLNMLSAQIAISVENTHLYEQLEEKVRQRTIELQEANEALETKHRELEVSHKKINDSVNYASKIQHAVLPARETFEKLFPRHFILYRPCSVVSGDFYWIKETGNKIIVVAADCTGHGVPGALVSMLGMAFLNEIVPHLAALSRLTAANILDELRHQVKIALQQKGKLSEQKDGMDIALCIIDRAEKQLQYAGAYNPLYLIRGNRLTEVKGDRMPVGIYRKERPFTLHEMPFQGGEMIYLFTDGFIHQNSAGHETFTRKRFKELLLDINREPVSKQEEALVKRFDEWKGPLPQRDDILVLGIRLPGD